MRPAPGTPIDCVMTKWGDRPHWEYVGDYLGSDEHGDWVGVPVGTSFSRPDAGFVGVNRQVSLFPRDLGWAAGFHGPGGTPWPSLDGAPVEVYVDITTPAVFTDTAVTCVDLDLDVVRGTNGVVYLDDEDEFAEHQVAFGYPPQVIAAAEATCAAVLAQVTAHDGPFDPAVWLPWLARVR